MFSIMAFMFLGFCGIWGILAYLVWHLEHHNRKLEANYAELMILLTNLNSRIANSTLNITKDAAEGNDLTKETNELLNLKFAWPKANPKAAIDTALDLHY